MEKHKFSTQLTACRMTIAYAFYPISQFVTYIGTDAILDLKKLKYGRAKLKLLVTYLFNGFTEKLKQSHNLCIQWSNQEADHQYGRQLRRVSMKNAEVKVRLRAVLQITSAQQHAPIHFILIYLKLNRTRDSTHWRRKYKTRSIRSTKSDRLTTRIRCGYNKQSEATPSTFARLFIRRRILKCPPFVTRICLSQTNSITGCFIRLHTHVHPSKLEWSNHVNTSAHSAAG